jgi:hypothetical protein
MGGAPAQATSDSPIRPSSAMRANSRTMVATPDQKIMVKPDLRSLLAR